MVSSIESSLFFRGTEVRGKVKWFSDAKGYGFIGLVNGPDLFVHYSDIVGEGYRTLRDGDFVEFEIVQTPRGPEAAKVVVNANELPRYPC